MPQFPFFLTSVFSEKTPSGEPCVVVLSDDLPLESLRQQLAYTFNGSEVVFAGRQPAQLAFHYPQFALPFSARGYLAAAAVYQAHCPEAPRRWHCTQGEFAVETMGEAWALRLPAGRSRAPNHGQVQLAHALGIESHEILPPLQLIYTGLEQLLIPVRSRQTVLQARPHPALLAEYADHGEPVAQAVIWHREHDLITMRCFMADHFGVYEDFGAGSAALNIGSYLLATGQRPPQQLKLEQGHTIQRLFSRLSHLHLQIDSQAQLTLSGKVQLLGQGVVNL
ncbi:PhzF family phenazine biosynthesis protein [Chitinibacter sp. ZOR0017]|uniref:PhzF family phenazine biosynthesis protein n=1 Tax=Chitinibacter sp. ZOR0017 TaxID=1339254 RepID=UPI0006464369|nr:PhzF family phenazine biosynthesis protein [Chitinibacter sp. ZOR0017]